MENLIVILIVVAATAVVVAKLRGQATGKGCCCARRGRSCGLGIHTEEGNANGKADGESQP